MPKIRHVSIADPSGVLFSIFAATPDGGTVASNLVYWRSDLYLVEGLK
jgi:hypothetical protein